MKNLNLRVALLTSLALISSCSMVSKKGQWGKNALYPLKGGRIIDAIKKNAQSAHVWGPVAGAVVFSASNFDRNFSNWVANEADVFKDKDAADAWSDNFNNILKAEMYATILLTASHNDDEDFWGYAWNKTKGGLVVNVAASSSRFSVDQVRKVVKRQRPNKIDLKSLPSGHASEAGSRRVIIGKGIDSIDMDPNLRFGVNALNTSMAIGTLWARVEGKRHYPSDVMLGYAFGSFISGVVYDSLINLDANETFVIIPGTDKLSAMYSYSF